ncbi:unnamed protein product [Heterobilharzia americana]|nr:unnamed protein product [Heterobilharzia americana]
MNSNTILLLFLTVWKTVKCEVNCGYPDSVSLDHTLQAQFGYLEKRSKMPTPLKFYPHFTLNFKYLTHASELKKLMQKAMRFWETTLTVRTPGSGRQLVKRNCKSGVMFTVTTRNANAKPCVVT